jgi:hypothetical protein
MASRLSALQNRSRKMKIHLALTLSTFMSLSFFWEGSAFAEDVSLQDKALAAGYKAMFTCSATFTGGKTAEQINQDELDNIYPDFAGGMAAIGEPK